MKVLHIAPTFYPAVTYGGPTESTYRLTLALAQDLGCEVDVLTTDANGASRLPLGPADRIWMPTPQMRVRYCRRSFGVSASLEMMCALPRAIRDADVVHLMAVYSAPTIPTLVLTRYFQKPVVWSPRGALLRWKGTRRRRLKSIWEAVCRLAAPHSLTLHVTSEEERISAIGRFRSARTAVIPNGVVIPRTIEPTTDETFRMVFLGRLDPIKGLENLIAACRLVRVQRPWRLTIAGAGTKTYEETLDRQIEELGLVGHIRKTGPLSHEDKAAFFADADVLILPSHSENFGIVVAESLAHAVPVIVSTGAPWARVSEIGCGLSVRNTPESLAEAITQLASSNHAAMGQRGREWMRSEFSWELIATRMESLYRSLVADGLRHGSTAARGDN